MVSNQGKITTLAADANVDKGLVDGTDKLHSGIIKVLESFAQGDMCISHAGFTITDGGDYTQYNLAQPIKFYKRGEFVNHTVTLTEAYTSTVQDATHSRYDWVLINPATPELVIVQGTAAATPLVSDITAGYIPIALVHISAGSDNDKFDYSFQTFTMNMVKNSLSIGRDDSGYTESLSIISNAGDVEIEAKEQDKDIVLKVNDGGSSTEVLRIDGSTGNVGIRLNQNTTADERLDVEDGNISLTTTDRTTERVIKLRNSGSTTSMSEIAMAGANSNNYEGYIAFKTKGPSDLFNDPLNEIMRIDGNGNVGIGTSSPSELLHLSDADASEPTILIENTGTNASEPELIFYRSTATGADSRDIGHVKFKARDTAGNIHTFVNLFADSEDADTTTEDGRLLFYVTKGGTDNVEQLRISGSSGIIFNEGGADIDVRIEGNSEANLFFTDAGNDRVGIGTNSPTGLFHVKGTSASDIDFMVEVAEDGASASPDIVYFRNSASPANGDDLAHIRFRGRDSAGNTADYVDIFAEIVDTTDGSEDGRITFRTLKNGSIISRIELDSDETVINDGGADVNFRVEGDTEANLIFADAGNDRVGIGTNTPSSELQVLGDINASNVTASEAITATTALTTNGLLFRNPEVLDNSATPPHSGPISGTKSIIYINDITATTPPATPNPSPNAVQLPDPASVENTIFTLSNIGGATVTITVATGEPINDSSTSHRLISTANQIDLPAGDAITVQAITDQIAPLVNGYYTISH